MPPPATTTTGTKRKRADASGGGRAAAARDESRRTDLHHKPDPVPLALELELFETRARGLRAFVVQRRDGKRVSGAYQTCVRAQPALTAIPGSDPTETKLESYWPREKTWNVSLDQHDQLVQVLRDVLKVPVMGLPRHIRALFMRPVRQPPTDDEIIRGLGSRSMWEAMFPYQREGVRFGIQMQGRFLCGDEMGVGKTRQGLAVCTYYARDGPCLVLCPSLLKDNWKAEFSEVSSLFQRETFAGPVRRALYSTDADTDDDEQRRVLDAILEAADRPLSPDRHIQIIRTGQDILQEGVQIVIASYEITNRPAMMRQLVARRFPTVLMDECHYIKTPEAKRSKAALQLCASARHRILLSGTPMARPREIFTQIQAVDPTIFPKFWPYNGRNAWSQDDDQFYFSVRYCDPTKQYLGWNRSVFVHNGCTRPAELFAVLNRLVMIRRRKADVLKDLPDKVRERVVMNELKPGELRDFARDLAEVDALRDERGTLSADPKFMELVRRTASLKVPMNVEYLKACMFPQMDDDPSLKILLFGHHRFMLDGIEEAVRQAGFASVRIDGSTKDTTRHEYVRAFQTDPTIRVAILSIQAAGVGITLTEASIVIFLELLFGQKEMFQAEDRAHRIGQRDTVFVRYLILAGSTDDVLWRMIARKVRNTGMVLDNRAEFVKVREVDARQRTLDDVWGSAGGGAGAGGGGGATDHDDNDENDNDGFIHDNDAII